MNLIRKHKLLLISPISLTEKEKYILEFIEERLREHTLFKNELDEFILNGKNIFSVRVNFLFVHDIEFFKNYKYIAEIKDLKEYLKYRIGKKLKINFQYIDYSYSFI